MIVELFVREGFNDNGKQIISIHRVHENDMSAFLRDVQNNGKYIQNHRLLRPIRVEHRMDDVSVGEMVERLHHDMVDGFDHDQSMAVGE